MTLKNKKKDGLKSGKKTDSIIKNKQNKSVKSSLKKNHSEGIRNISTKKDKIIRDKKNSNKLNTVSEKKEVQRTAVKKAAKKTVLIKPAGTVKSAKKVVTGSAKDKKISPTAKKTAQKNYDSFPEKNKAKEKKEVQRTVVKKAAKKTVLIKPAVTAKKVSLKSLQPKKKIVSGKSSKKTVRVKSSAENSSKKLSGKNSAFSDIKSDDKRKDKKISIKNEPQRKPADKKKSGKFSGSESSLKTHLPEKNEVHFTDEASLLKGKSFFSKESLKTLNMLGSKALKAVREGFSVKVSEEIPAEAKKRSAKKVRKKSRRKPVDVQKEKNSKISEVQDCISELPAEPLTEKKSAEISEEPAAVDLIANIIPPNVSSEEKSSDKKEKQSGEDEIFIENVMFKSVPSLREQKPFEDSSNEVLAENKLQKTVETPSLYKDVDDDYQEQSIEEKKDEIVEELSSSEPFNENSESEAYWPLYDTSLPESSEDYSEQLNDKTVKNGAFYRDLLEKNKQRREEISEGLGSELLIKEEDHLRSRLFSIDRPLNASVQAELLIEKEEQERKKAESDIVEVPSFFGCDLFRSLESARSLGLNVETVFYEDSWKETNVIIRQSIAPGESVPVGSSVVFTASGRNPIRFLPSIYQKTDAQNGDFLKRYLWIIQTLVNGISIKLDNHYCFYNPMEAPKEFFEWIASWFSMNLNYAIEEKRLRLLIKEAVTLYRWRGTSEGLCYFLEIVTGARPEIIEGYSPHSEFIVGSETPAEMTIINKQNTPYFFTIHFPIYSGTFSQDLMKLINEIIQREKPVNTDYYITFIRKISENASGKTFEIGKEVFE